MKISLIVDEDLNESSFERAGLGRIDTLTRETPAYTREHEIAFSSFSQIIKKVDAA
jgi:hypothetical protein